jgi:hypothetical protein
VLALAVCASVAPADIIVNAPQAVTRRVTVQLIQTALDNGLSPATVFGNATERADIEGSIDAIWAQAGIDIAILPTINRYNNTFAYQGNAGSGTRPSSDLNTIFANASSTGGILNADQLALNLILVNVVPAFSPLSENSSAGYARISGNGIIGYVGDNLLTFDNGLDVIAGVMAHEIGHNLGLDHTANGQPNLMSPNGTTEQLTASQIDIARSSDFARMVAKPISGDYNNNGVVDAADYVVWRKSHGSQSDYTTWRANFGKPPGSGSATGASPSQASVPEPATLVLLAFAANASCLRRRRAP